MDRSICTALTLTACLLAACSNNGNQAASDQPTTVTGRPVISPPRRLICRLREATEGDEAKKSPAPVDVVKLDKVTSTEARVGDTLRVELKAATGTGYQWIFAGCEGDPSDPKAPLTPQFNFRKGEGTVEPLEPGKPGAPAHWVFEFKAANAGTTTMHFMLVRPWEKNAKPADQRSLKVDVRKP